MDEEFLIINIPEKFQFCVLNKNIITGIVLLHQKLTNEYEIFIKGDNGETFVKITFGEGEQVTAQREYKILVSQLVEDFDGAIEEMEDYRNELIEENLEVLDG